MPTSGCLLAKCSPHPNIEKQVVTGNPSASGIKKRWTLKETGRNSSLSYRLKLNNLKLYGREKELAALKDVYDRVGGQDCAAQVVLLHGSSGSGKTAVVQKLAETIENGVSYYVSGKFDQQVNAKPFSALADALTVLCGILLRAPDREEYKKKISESLREEWRTLAEVIPNLAQLLGEETLDFNSSVPANALIRLKTLCRVFLRSISSPDHPIVIFLDDLQFSDAASVDLIDSLLADKELKNFLFISAYRDEEVTDAIQRLLNKGSFTSIGVGSLTVKCINELLSDVTNSKHDLTKPLAEVVFNKTHGNCFFVLQFIKLLQEEGLLCFSTKDYRWEWDVEKIESDMNISENVVDLVIGRLQQLPKEVQKLLNIASCMGAQFETALLATLFKRKDEEVEKNGLTGVQQESIQLMAASDEDAVRDMLRLPEDQELVVAISTSTFKYSHDRIQQAAYLLLPEGPEKRLMELRIGLQMLTLFRSSISKRWMLFVSVNSLNRSSSLLDLNQKIELVRLNLETAKLAEVESAFLLAAGYLREGIVLLDETRKWKDNYKLTLEMYSLSAKMEQIGGNCKKAEAISNEIVANSNVLEEDKIPVYHTMMLAVGNQLKLERALYIGMGALARLGVHLPRHPTMIRVLMDLWKTQKLVSGMADDELLSIPSMTDEKKRQAMTFLLPMQAYAWSLGNGELLSLIFMKGMRVTIRYGACEITPAAFACYGMLMGNMGNETEAFRFGEISERMLERKEMVRSKAFALTVIHATTHHWKRPLHLSAEPLLEAHCVGMMQTGDVEWANLATGTYSSMYGNSGLPLKPFTSDVKKFVQTMREYEQEVSLIFAVVPWQFALNLMGHSEDPLVLTGEAMDQEETLRQLWEVNNKAGVFFTTLFRLQVTYIMGAVDLACHLARELWALRVNTFKGNFNYNAGVFFSGLAEFAYARKIGARKCPRRAMRHYRMIASFEKHGAVNCHPMRLLLEAEAATFGGGDHDDIRKLYDSAISAASRCGYTNYAAIASERAAEYNMMDCGDSFWGQVYIAKARDRYAHWGAEGKVAQLENMHQSLLRGVRRQSMSSSSMNVRGLERYTKPRVRGVSDLQRDELSRSTKTAATTSSIGF